MKRHRVMLAKSGLRKWTLMLFAVCIASSVFGQKIGVKTNLLYDATTTMNLGFEFGLAPRWTLELSGSYNPWTLDEGKNKKIKHWAVISEARYWLCNRFQGHFSVCTAVIPSLISVPFVFPSSRSLRRITAIRVGVPVWGLPTDIRGFWANVGIWRLHSVWDIFIRIMTNMSVPLAASSRQIPTTIISVLRRRGCLSYS